MSTKKPIKNEDGKLKEFNSSDNLPNQDEIDELKDLLSELVKELLTIGFPINSTKLLKLLK